MSWWNEITFTEQILYIIAASSTIILLIQTVLSMIGFDSDAAELPGAPDFTEGGGFSEAADLGDLTDANPDGVFDGNGTPNEGGFNGSDTAGLRIFTVRGMLSFFSIGSWVTIVVYKALTNFYLAFGIGILAGLLTMFLIAKGFQLAMRLQSSGNIDLRNAVGVVGEVYLTIPPKGEGKGKVSVVVQERLKVYDAIAYEDNKISTGRDIKVLDVLGPDLLLVESTEKEQKKQEA